MVTESDLPEEHVATAEEQARLGLFPGEMVYSITKVRFVGNQLAIESRHLPSAAFPGLLAKGHMANITVLSKDYGLQLESATERISVDVASEMIAKALNVPKGTIVLKLDRVVHLKDSRPIEWRITYTLDCDHLRKL